jgi:formylglycine-generating enzyme required for sulfatase activity
MRRFYFYGLVALAGATGAGACAQVAGIEDARPGWTIGTSSTTSSSSGSGGSGGTGGSGGAAPTCTDSFKNGAETAVDCGGGKCPPCGVGKGCLVGPDCETSVCVGGTCVPTSCADHINNGTETDIDCGGLACPGCADGKACEVPGDCLSGHCVANICWPPSCAAGGPGMTNCGPTADESCCTSPLVPGGNFYRSYDGVTYTSMAAPAKVSGFRLDKYEVTVGRFRQFVAAWVSGWRPAPGAGKHTHVAGGGLSGGAESGWDPAWATGLATTASAWDDASHLACGAPDATWTPAAGSNENRPINCVNVYEAYAFCIWDGGFLASEAEWNYAAAGGNEQRVYPWSSPANTTTIDCSYANAFSSAFCAATHTNDVGSESPKGNGKWGHTDLAGNVWEWVLDWYQDYGATCDDCAQLTSSSERVIRGGSFLNDPPQVAASYRKSDSPPVRTIYHGARCARSP